MSPRPSLCRPAAGQIKRCGDSEVVEAALGLVPASPAPGAGIVAVEHRLRARHDAELGIVPGTSHVLTLEKPDLVNRVILDYLAETGPPETMMPIRRRS